MLLYPLDLLRPHESQPPRLLPTFTLFVNLRLTVSPFVPLDALAHVTKGGRKLLPETNRHIREHIICSYGVAIWTSPHSELPFSSSFVDHLMATASP